MVIMIVRSLFECFPKSNCHKIIGNYFNSLETFNYPMHVTLEYFWGSQAASASSGITQKVC